MPSPLPDHPRNSSYSLQLYPVCSSWMVVMLGFFGFSGSYRVRYFFICQLSLWLIFIPLEVTSRLFSSSGDHPEASSNSLAEKISGFLQLPREPLRTHAFGAFFLPEKTSQWALYFLAKPLPFTWPRTMIRLIFKRCFMSSCIRYPVVSFLDSPNSWNSEVDPSNASSFLYFLSTWLLVVTTGLTSECFTISV